MFRKIGDSVAFKKIGKKILKAQPNCKATGWAM